MKGEFYKMYHGSWDIATMDLTLEQEAAYLRLCHAMYQKHGPIENSTRVLKSLFRCGNVKATALLDALIKVGKIQLTQDGKLTNPNVSEQLAERAEISAKRASAGERGGKARRQTDDSLANFGGVNGECGPTDARVNVECSPSDHRVITANPLKGNNSPMANASLEKRREEKRNPLKSPEGGGTDRFPEFRAAYPARNTAFPATAARKRWGEAKRLGVSEDEMIAAAKAYAAEQKRNGKVGTEYVKMADSWLHQQRWRDYAPSPTALSAPAPAVSDDDWRRRVQLWRDRLGDWPHPSPAPNMPGTLVPHAVLAEFGVIEPPGRPPSGIPLGRAA